MQGVIVLVISNRPRAARSSDFEIIRAITPWMTPLGPISITCYYYYSKLLLPQILSLRFCDILS